MMMYKDIDNYLTKEHILKLLELGVITVSEDSLFFPDDMITTEQFVTMIIRGCIGNNDRVHEGLFTKYMDYALHKGLIEDYDMVNKSNRIERRSAARIVHEALKIELGEIDELQWSAAETLKDLYQCHTCVMHIAQVYVKGIMLEQENNVFGVLGNITRAEAASIVVRMIDKEQREPKTNNRKIQCKELSPDQAWELLSNDKTAILVDVRSNEEYVIGHIPGSVSVPLKGILNNPFSIYERKDTPLILYCQSGYKSSIAAKALIAAGYRKIYTIPGIDQYDLYKYE